MAVAGKVAITLSTENGGAWSADVTYDRLVAVKHNNNLYISRKAVANVEPPNDEFWFLALEGFSGDDIEDIIDGTTQVGNARTLDGHGAEYFATTDDTKAVKIKGTINTLFTPTEEGTWFVANNADGTFPYSYGLLEIRYGSYNGEFAATFKSTGIDNRLYYNTFVNVDGVGTWSGWENLSTMFDLANYIAKADKPTGSYTGNGSTEHRSIATNGIGRTVVILSDYGSVLVIGGYAIGISNTVTPLHNEVNFVNGVIGLGSTNQLLNASGVAYTYWVL